jgi:hypothetical protein
MQGPLVSALEWQRLGHVTGAELKDNRKTSFSGLFSLACISPGKKGQPCSGWPQVLGEDA